MSFEIVVFCKMSCIVTEKHLAKFTFKLSFVDTNVAENDCILQKKPKKQAIKNQSFSVTLWLNYRQLQFIKISVCTETASSFSYIPCMSKQLSHII